MNIDFLDSPSYTLYLNSADRINTTGNNNSATFNINWAAFLPINYDQYKVCYSFVSSGGYYKDGTSNSNFNNCRIEVDFQGRSLSYNSKTGGPSNILGFASRDLQTAGASSNCFSCFFYQFPAKTISRPTQNTLTINIFNAGTQNNLLNQLLVDTNAAGTALVADMTAWCMVLEFIPVASSIKTK